MEPVNILHIITDQQCAFTLSCTGNRYLSTPNLDSLAGRGVRFERTYSAQAVCTANRSSMLLGLMPSKIGDHAETYPPCRRAWTKEELQRQSIGWCMAEAGYHTAYAGKWHVTYCSRTEPALGIPQDHGFEWLGPEGGDYYCGEAWSVLPQCRQFLMRKHEKPFYLTVSLTQPHGICFWGGLPGFAPEKWPEGVDPWDPRFEGDAAKFPNVLPPNHGIFPPEPEALAMRRKGWARFAFRGRSGVSREWTDEQIWRCYVWTYYRLCEQADREIGAVLTALRESGLQEHTLVVYSSDHGDGAARHALRNKDVLYDEAARIPLIVAGPGVDGGGRVDVDHLVSCGVDFFPTLADYAGARVPDTCRGASFRALIEGRKTDWRNRLFAESPEGRMMRTRQWKYCVYLKSPSCPEQLFDMIADPGECRNLAQDPAHQSVLQECRGMLREHIRDTDDPFPVDEIVRG
jgi:arylsulfatase A-like enzyme